MNHAPLWSAASNWLCLTTAGSPPPLFRWLPVYLVRERGEPDRSEPFPWLFGWRMGGLSWLQGGIFLSEAGWTRSSKSDERSRSSRVDSHQTLNSFNQTLKGATCPQSFNQTLKRVGFVPKSRSATKHRTGWLRPKKLGWIQPNPPNPQPNTRLLSVWISS
jgi:hypothetical protein